MRAVQAEELAPPGDDKSIARKSRAGRSYSSHKLCARPHCLTLPLWGIIYTGVKPGCHAKAWALGAKASQAIMCVRCRRCKIGKEEERQCNGDRQEAAAKGKGPAICTRCKCSPPIDYASSCSKHDNALACMHCIHHCKIHNI